jgi:hypothetical protein
MQWTGDPGRWRALQDLAAEMGRPWQSPEVQLELLKRELHVQWTSYTARDTFFETDSVEEATRLFCTYWVRPGIPRLDIRTEAAWRYYIIMVMYSPDGSDAQMRVVTAASAGSMYGAGVNECQKWVDEVYRACGYSFSAQPSASHARLAWSVSTDISTMPPGSVIFSGPDYHSGVYVGGLDAGHVGIYLGNGLVANNRNGSTVSIDTLEWWTAAFGYGGWGFPCQL